MSFRTRLAKWLIGDRPELVREPSLEHVDHLLDLAELARLEGRSFAPIPTEETVIVLLALLKRLEDERAAATTARLPFVDSEAGARALRTIHEARELVDRQLAELRQSDPLRCTACGATSEGEPHNCDVCGGGYMQREPV